MGGCQSSTNPVQNDRPKRPNNKNQNAGGGGDDKMLDTAPPFDGTNRPTASLLSPSVTLQNLLQKPNLSDVRQVGERGLKDIGSTAVAGAHHLRNVFAKPLETWGTSYKIPIFPKSEDDKEYLENALKQNYVFENLKHAQIFPMVQALEKTERKAGDVIIEQGDSGDYFYILMNGTCDFVVDGQHVGQANAGDSFGELALLYDAPRAATVKCTADCILYRVDQAAFRHILQKQAQSGEQIKTQLLEKIVFLQDLASSERSKLAAVMTPKPFHKDDTLVVKGTKSTDFMIIKEGEIKKTDIGKGNIHYEDTVMKAGDYMGEGAITANVPNYYNATALTDGMLFTIDSETFRKVLGDLDGLIIRSLDRKFLAGIKIFQQTQLDGPTLASLSNFIQDRKYRKGRKICVEGTENEAAFYLIRTGRIRIYKQDGSQDEVIAGGGYFGEDQLLADVIRGKNGPYDPTTAQMGYTVEVVDDCVCGVLTLAVCRKCLDTTNMGKPHASILDSLVTRQIPLNDLKKHKILGAGTFGQVWLVSRKTSVGDRRAYALKVQSKYELVEAGQARAVVYEKNIMAQLHSPFIIQLVTTYKDDQFVYMLMQLVQGGELYAIMHSTRRDGLPENKARFYAAGIAEGLSYMHRRGFVYRDLKPENVLIDSKGYPVIVDFGFAKLVVDKTYTLCGTPLYLAPEVILNRGHNGAADNWSLGVLIYEMICGHTPFYRSGMDQSDLFKAIIRGRYNLPPRMTAPLANLVQGLLMKDPNLRLGSLANGEADIINHKFFDGLDIEALRKGEVAAPVVPKIKNPLDASNFEDWSHLEDKTTQTFPSLSRDKEEIFEKF